MRPIPLSPRRTGRAPAADPWDLYGLHFWKDANGEFSKGIVAADNGTAFLYSSTVETCEGCDPIEEDSWVTVRPAQHSLNGTCPLTAGNIEFYGVDVNPANPDEVWMSGGEGTTLGYVYRSLDRGQT